MESNEFCSHFVTGDCNKEIEAVCARFQVELELTEAYVMFDVSHPCEINDGGGVWYDIPAGERVTVNTNNTTIVQIRSDEGVEYIKILSDTVKRFTILKGENLITANNMCSGLEELEEFELVGFNMIIDWESAFDGCLKLTKINDFFVIPETLGVYAEDGAEIEAPIPTVINMKRIFTDCQSLTYIPNIDFSRTNTLEEGFYGCKNILNMQDFFPEEEWTADRLFSGCTALKNVPASSYNKITTANEMYMECYNIQLAKDINLEIATSTSMFFYKCTDLKIVNNLQTPVSINMNKFFEKCIQLKCIDYLDTRLAGPVTDLFLNSRKLQVPSPSEQELLSAGDEFTKHSFCPPREEDKIFSMEIDYKLDYNNIEYPTFTFDQDVVVDWGADIYCDMESPDTVTPGTYEPPYDECVPLGSDIGFNVIEGEHTYSYKAGTTIEYIGGKILKGDNIKISSLFDVTSMRIFDNEIVTNVIFHKSNTITDFTNSFKNNISLQSVDFGRDESLIASPTNINSMFEGASFLAAMPLFVTTNVVTASHAFDECTLINELPEYSKYYTELTDASYMFANTNIDNFDMVIDNTNPKIFDSMFENCGGLTLVKVLNTSGGISFDRIFYGCILLSCINALDTSSVTETQIDMFTRCTVLESPNFDEQDQLADGFVFANSLGCPIDKNLRTFQTKLDLSVLKSEDDKINLLENLPDITSTQNFFVDWGDGVHTAHRKNTIASKEISIIDIIHIPLGTVPNPIYVWCYQDVESVKIGMNKTIVSASIQKHYTITSIEEMFAYNEAMTECVFVGAQQQGYTSAIITKMDRAFLGCYMLNEAPKMWTTDATSTVSLFEGCSSLSSVTNFYAQKLENASAMFKNCNGLLNVDLHQDITGNHTITKMYEMFYSAVTLNSVKNVNIDNCLDFYRAYSRTAIAKFEQTIPSSPELEPTLARNYTEMFADCPMLECIGNLNTEHNIGNDNIFDNDNMLVVPTPKIIENLQSTQGYVFENTYDNCLPGRYDDVFDINFTFEGEAPYLLNFMADDDCVAYYWDTGVYEVIKANTALIYSQTSNVSVRSYGEPSTFSVEGSNISTATINMANDKFTNMDRSFKDCRNLITVGTPSSSYTFYVTSVEQLFQGCANLVSSSLMFPRATNLNSQYSQCTHLSSLYTQRLNSAVTVDNMFDNCISLPSVTFNYHPDVPVVGPITSASHMFNRCMMLREIFGLEDKMASCTHFDSAFYATQIKHLDIQTTAGTHFAEMFFDAWALECLAQIDTTNMLASSEDIFNSQNNSLMRPDSTEIQLIEDDKILWINDEVCPLPGFQLEVTMATDGQYTVEFFTDNKYNTWRFKAIDVATGNELALYPSSGMLADPVTVGQVVRFESTDEIKTFYMDSSRRAYTELNFIKCDDLTGFGFTDYWLAGIGSSTLAHVTVPANNIISYLYRAFKGSTNLLSVTGINYEQVISLRQAFMGCTNLGSSGEVFTIGQTAHCGQFDNMFDGCSLLEKISEIDTTKPGAITTDMFLGCDAMTSPDAAAQADIVAGSHWIYS